MRSTARNRALQVLGACVLILAVGTPSSIKVLQRLGALQGWNGFGLFVISLNLAPFLACSGLLALVLGTVRRKRLEEGRDPSR